MTQTWAFVESGDVITYADGSSFLVESFVIEEPSGISSMYVRCVVGPEYFEWQFGQAGIMSINKHSRTPDGMMVIKGLI